MQPQNEKLMSYKLHFKKNIHLALPIMISQLGQVAVGVADSLMVGRLGTEELAAVAFGHSIFIVFMVFGMGLSYGMTPLIAEADGRKNTKEIGALLRDGFWLCFLSGVLLMLVMLGLAPLFSFMGQDPAIVPMAQSYFLIIVVSFLPLMCFQSFRMLAEGLSDTKRAMYITLVCNGLNIVLNALLIYGLLGFPQLGIYGAALSTLIARVLMMGWMAYYVLKDKKFQFLDINLSPGLIERFRMRKILSLGIPTGLQYVFESTSFALAAILAGWISATALASHQIAISLASVSYIVATGIGAAAVVRVGNQLGERNYENLKMAANSLFVMTVAWMTFCGAILFLGRFLLPSLFSTDIEVIQLTSVLIMIAVLFQLSDGLQVFALGALRGIKDVKIPTMLTFIAYWLVALPLAWFLGIFLDLGAPGIWYGLAGGLTMAAILLNFRFYRKVNRLIRENKSVES